MKEALPAHPPPRETDGPPADAPEAMKDGLAAAATAPHDDDATAAGAERPKG